MAKKQSQLLKRLIAISLAAMLTVGGLPATAGGGFGFDTGIVANAAATTVSDADGFLAAIANGGEIQLTSDITITSAVTISKECTIDFNGKTLAFNGSGVNLTVSAPTTLNNGTLTFTDGKEVLNANANTAVNKMTIQCPGNVGGNGMVKLSDCTFTMTDSTITYTDSSQFSTRGIWVNGGVNLLFYGDNTIDGNMEDQSC